MTGRSSLGGNIPAEKDVSQDGLARDDMTGGISGVFGLGGGIKCSKLLFEEEKNAGRTLIGPLYRQGDV